MGAYLTNNQEIWRQRSPERREGVQNKSKRKVRNEKGKRMKVSNVTLRESTRPAKPDRQPETSLGWRPETASSSVGSELQSRVIEPRKDWYLGEPACLSQRGQHRSVVMVWRGGPSGVGEQGKATQGCLGSWESLLSPRQENRIGPHR